MAKLSGNGCMTAARIYAIALFQSDLAFCTPLIQLVFRSKTAGPYAGIHDKGIYREVDHYLFLPSSLDLAVHFYSARTAESGCVIL